MKNCVCCKRPYQQRQAYKSRYCASCIPMISAGMSYVEVCEAKADKTQSTIEAQRLANVAAEHRAEQEANSQTDAVRIERMKQLEALKTGYKQRKQVIVERISTRKNTRTVYRCGRCGHLLSSRRCIACELEIVSSVK